MGAASEAVSMQKPKAYRAIFWGGLTAGILDITAAFINSSFRGRGPVFVLQSVAAGLLGADSFKGGAAAAMLGAVMHFTIAFTATVVFYAASRKLKLMVRLPVLSGLLYGIAVYLFMYFVVLPLAYPLNITYTFVAVVTGLIIHMLCVGLPISLAVRRFSAVPLTLSLLALMAFVCGSGNSVAAAPFYEKPNTTPDTPVVLVELFTSEGCSTCPPADKLLADLEQSQMVNGVQVVALSEHVDYWNRLGWKDPFSSAEFTWRQIDYAQALSVKDVYTPQMIVDGRAEFVGSNSAAAREAITKAASLPKANVSMSIKSSAPKSVTLEVQIENIPDVSRGDVADVMLAVTESGLMSDVTRGENSGRKLAHSAVTRRLFKIGTIDGKTFRAAHKVELDSKWKQENMKAVIFVQERAFRRVLGVAAIRLMS
ncbi:MAG TPA: DUF1223 domain-containing protein [Blastocatellia bacterium]|nr:DUF1223 domain-containing protein [Blastocatellia bacterium]